MSLQDLFRENVLARIAYGLLIAASVAVASNLGLHKTLLGDYAFSVFLFLAIFVSAKLLYSKRPFWSLSFLIGLCALVCILVLRVFVVFVAAIVTGAVSALLTVVLIESRGAADIARNIALRADANLYYFMKYLREGNSHYSADKSRDLWCKIPVYQRDNWTNCSDIEKQQLIAEAEKKLLEESEENKAKTGQPKSQPSE
ncbi:MAG: hypothetical protein ABIH04_10705 [Planctomycetota bacterium]